MCLCIYLCVYALEYNVHTSQREHWLSLELELEAVVNCWTWMLETKLRSSERAAQDSQLLRCLSSHWLCVLKQFLMQTISGTSQVH